MRRGHTDKETQVSLSGNDIIGNILSQGYTLLPFAVGPHGTLGSIARQFLCGTPAPPIDDFPDNRPHASAAVRVVSSRVIPSGTLPRADALLRKHHPESFFGGSYKSIHPSTYFEQQLGLVISTAISSHLLLAHEYIRNKSPVPCSCEAGSDDCALEGRWNCVCPLSSDHGGTLSCPGICNCATTPPDAAPGASPICPIDPR